MPYKKGTIILHSRRYVDPFNLHQSEIDILDIAHALSNKCRYGGHCPRFYSVAEHSIEVANWLARAGASIETQMAGLLHDGGETYTPDVLGPIKANMVFAGMRELEETILAKIFSKFNIAPSLDEWELVQDADNDILRSEVISLWDCQPIDWGLDLPTDYVSIGGVRPRDAKVLFEQRFMELQIARKEGV